MAGRFGKQKGLPICWQAALSSNAEMEFFYRLKGSGFILSLLYVQPDIRFAAAVAADGMTFGFAFTFSHDMGCNVGCFVFFQGAGNDHFGLVPAVFTCTHLFELFLWHK
jgi:hypothetical protein